MIQSAQQPSLFDRAPIVSNGDPSTSRMAAVALTVSGARSLRKTAVLNFLRRQASPMNSYELAGAMGQDRHEVAKRLPDLGRDGLVVNGAECICRIARGPALTWRPAVLTCNHGLPVTLACHPCDETFQVPATAVERAGGPLPVMRTVDGGVAMSPAPACIQTWRVSAVCAEWGDEIRRNTHIAGDMRLLCAGCCPACNAAGGSEAA